MSELMKLSKQALSIVETATLKDDEIKMWIQAGIRDLKRQGIKASEEAEDSLIKSAIVMFVKSNFGNVDIKEKDLAKERYSLLCNNLSLSEKYKIKEEKKMRDVSCKLLSTTYKKNEKGVQIPNKITEVEVPIIKVETVYANEYYEANQAGYKPTLRLKISALNYNNETELIYKKTTYTIIRVDETYADEITLICERKIKNV